MQRETQMKTNQLTGAALDWAVVKCECNMPAPFKSIPVVLNGTVRVFRGDMGLHSDPISPSTNWAQGGMIIEREKLDVFCSGSVWDASTGDRHPNVIKTGLTPLIAAMRCYVASKLGDEVEIPTELTQGEAACLI